MEAPKCRLCGKRHYGLCEFAGDEPATEGPGNPQGLPDNQSSPDGVRPLTNAERSEMERITKETHAEAKKVLSNAERQKRYRERHGDEYRKRNRERMQRKRNVT